MEECQVLMAGVRKEFCNPELRLYTIFRFVYGQKSPVAVASAPSAPTIAITSHD